MLAPVPEATWSPVWTAGAASPGVRRAMAADGLLVEVLPGVWLPTDLAGDPAARAAALAVHLAGGSEAGHRAVRQPGSRRRETRRRAGWGPPAGAVVALAAAAWVHGCPSPPRRVDLLVPRGTGPCGPVGVVRLRRVADPGRGACSLGSLAVTGPARTVEDLRASSDPDDAAALRWALGLPAPRPGRPGGTGRPGARPGQVPGQAPACSSRRPVAR